MRAGFGLAALLLVVPLTAAAQDDGYGYRYDPAGDSGLSSFAGLRGSLAFTSKASTSVPTTPPTSLRASSDIGGGSIYVGTRLPLGLRLELEALYRYLPINRVDLGGVTVAGSGRAHLAGPMLNLFFDLPVQDFPFRPFIGGGIGGAYVTANVADGAGGNDYYRPSDWQFAYQVMGGAEIPLSQSSRFTAMYRWLEVNGIQGKCAASGPPTLTCKSNLNSQSIDLGLEMDM